MDLYLLFLDTPHFHYDDTFTSGKPICFDAVSGSFESLCFPILFKTSVNRLAAGGKSRLDWFCNGWYRIRNLAGLCNLQTNSGHLFRRAYHTEQYLIINLCETCIPDIVSLILVRYSKHRISQAQDIQITDDDSPANDYWKWNLIVHVARKGNKAGYYPFHPLHSQKLKSTTVVNIVYAMTYVYCLIAIFAPSDG